MTWMIVWGQKSKHQKIPGPKIPPPPKKKKKKKTIQNYEAEIREHHHELIFSYTKPPKIILA